MMLFWKMACKNDCTCHACIVDMDYNNFGWQWQTAQ